jgi:DNA-binding transcriptional ArsR family regulator
MIDRLSRGPASVSELAEPTHLALPSAVKHLVLLEKSGLVKSRKRGRVRTYHMPANAFSEVERWVERRKATWERRFDRLDQYLAQTGNRSAKRRGS